jgi:hypothetical protein
VPLSVGNDELAVVVFNDLGATGVREGKPVSVQWRWFDSKPTLPLWGLLGILLVVPRQNRHWQVWLILVLPLLVVSLRAPCLVPSLGSSADFDLMIQLLVTFAIAWSVVWLKAPYISAGSRWRRFLSALALMLGVGLFAYVSYFGFWCDSQESGMVIGCWCIGSLSLVASLMLSGMNCQQDGHARNSRLWFTLWLFISSFLCTALVFGSAILIVERSIHVSLLLEVFFAILALSLFVFVVLYLLNLPVLILTDLTDSYRQRLRDLVCGDAADRPVMAIAPEAAGGPK